MDSPYKFQKQSCHQKTKWLPNTKLSITHSFLELQNPDFLWNFVWTVHINSENKMAAIRRQLLVQKRTKREKTQKSKKSNKSKKKKEKKLTCAPAISTSYLFQNFPIFNFLLEMIDFLKSFEIFNFDNFCKS